MDPTPYILYLVECEDGSIYTGITTDLDRRLKEHASRLGPGAKYTRAHRVKRLLYTEGHADRSAASKREAEIKKWRKERKLRLIGSPTPPRASLPDRTVRG